MEDWISYSHQSLSVTLRYPNPTPSGNSVSIREISSQSSFRAHFVSDGSNDVYFEVARYSSLTAEQAINDFLKDVSQRINGLEASDVEVFMFRSYPAHRFTIHWAAKERVVLFIEKDDALYRIIHDPTSMINKRMLESIEFR